MNPATGYCLGCYRTLEEITAWSRMDDMAKRAVLRVLPARQAPQTGAPCCNETSGLGRSDN